jgi:hypothetical protein
MLLTPSRCFVVFGARKTISNVRHPANSLCAHLNFVEKEIASARRSRIIHAPFCPLTADILSFRKLQ